MKKYFVFLGIAALTLAACTKTEIDETAIPDQKIEFNVASYVPQTRADNYVSLVKETTTFSTMAYLHAEGVTTVQDYFGATGETITADNATNPSAWLPSHDYYWPKSKKSYINFVSWYDNGGKPTIDKTAKTMTWSERTIATTDNIMFADVAWHYNTNTTSTENNTMFGAPEGTKVFGQNQVKAGVPTLFHHALSKLNIKAQCNPVEKADSRDATKKTTWDVTLENIKITNTYNAGTLALTVTEPTPLPDPIVGKTSPWTGSWAPSGTASGITMANTSTLNTELVDVLAEQSVLPQTLGDEAYLEFDLHIITKFNGAQYSEEKPHVKVALKTLVGTAAGSTPITEWKMNYKYIYKIIINPETTTVKFDPAVVEWVTYTPDSEYNVPAGQI